MDTLITLPEMVQRLIRERVHSVEELETLLLLASESERWWSDEQVAAALRIPTSLAKSALRWLVDNGLCRSADPARGPIQFAPDSDEVREAVEELSRLYRERQVEVLVFISRSALSRVRNDALRTFAEAFLISGRKKDG